MKNHICEGIQSALVFESNDLRETGEGCSSLDQITILRDGDPFATWEFLLDDGLGSVMYVWGFKFCPFCGEKLEEPVPQPIAETKTA